ncbi:type III-B CRISPR module RAMP protein Cmr4 [Syntrophothermus lipocalidus]|uniref:CRISPR-associated RAMP protein, Cmr4 family n=1 Tax=Syntrophothermus lipocalidus (strain DSM 12680 / TGB-C1) TaxID=643648 RepID=D7CN32_SYNLT|nr:type III-B CRISPR module RAMP protein Cmr4 [Syntrophothermus lipocalidus]ADI02117.1 CRISPR-associated RAMP protein, Cmr4 family [Syntrophothermus lipocalidus DSM 12680]HOV43765.1 type III-B CRISPR module RAMP protein Cmr4 [Syntrophothermus lipocalidus]
MLKKFFIIECLTNMHVGTGSTSGGTIDLEVQRDETTGFPVIYASSLKGALREHFEQHVYAGSQNKVDEMFGDPNTKGKLRILQALMLGRPVRCQEQPWILVTMKEVLQEFVDLYERLEGATDPVGNTCLKGLRDFLANKDKSQNNGRSQKINIEGELASQPVLKGRSWIKCLFGTEDIVILEKEQCRIFRELPVAARNHLENGISKNLWYEEFVPHKSRFFFAVLAEESDEAILEDFAKKVQQMPVQIGANATVGYGYTNIMELKTGADGAENCTGGEGVDA